MKEPRLTLTPNTKGEVIDRQCPECGAWASEHEVIAQSRIASGQLTLAEMRALPPSALYSGNDFLKCPR